MKRGEKRKLFILLITYVLYLIIGSIIFQAAEKNSPDGRSEMKNAFEELKLKTNLTRKDFDKTVKEIQLILKKTGYGSKWTFYSSLYFCGSVVTTIGYGHMTPKTAAGRIILMFYAIIGIPLNLWTLKVMGDAIRSILSKLISKFEKVVLHRTEERHLNLKILAWMAALNVSMLLIGGAMYRWSENWSFLESVYYCFIVYSTIGFGDLVPTEGHTAATNKEIVMMFVRAFNLFIGLSLLSSLLSSIIQAADDLKVAFPQVKVHPFRKLQKKVSRELTNGQPAKSTGTVTKSTGNKKPPRLITVAEQKNNNENKVSKEQAEQPEEKQMTTTKI